MSYSMLVACIYEYIYIIHKRFDFLNKDINSCWKTDLRVDDDGRRRLRLE